MVPSERQASALLHVLFQPVVRPLAVRARGLHVTVSQVLGHILKLEARSHQPRSRRVAQRVQAQVGNPFPLA